jgi:phage terminase large subunit-like protein
MSYNRGCIGEYIELVRSNVFPSCKQQFQLCDFIERAFKAGDIYVDEAQLEKYLAYQKYFPFQLFPWEKFLFALHNCTYYKGTGQLRFPTLFIYVGRGSGKNGFNSFENFCLLTPTNGVQYYNIDDFANNEEQAKVSFTDVYNVLEDNKEKMLKHFRWNKERILNLKTKSEYMFRTSNARTKDGGRPGKITFDEVHEYENYAIIQVAKTGLGKKEHPRTTIMSTDGHVRDGVLDRYKERALAILSGEEYDHGFLPFVCRLDSITEIDDEAAWHKANPSLRYLPNLLNEMRMEYHDYTMDKVSNSDFATKRMNLPQGDADSEVTSWENVLATNQPGFDFHGMPCIVGIDYATTTDFVAAGFLFWKDGKFLWHTHTWVCSNGKDLSRIKAPLKEWEGQGFLTFVDALEVNPSLVTDWMLTTISEYRLIVKRVCVDKFRYTLISKALDDAGFSSSSRDGIIKLVRPSDEMMVMPTITSNFVNHNFIWGDNPLMRWYCNNSKVERVGINYVYSKIEPKSRKTDGFKAFVSAMTEFTQINKTFSCGNFDAYVY